MPTLDYTSLITFSCLVQCLFSIVYLSAYRWKRNKWLVLFFVIIFLEHLGVFIGIERPVFYQKLWMGNPGMLMATYPSLYLFTKELVSVHLKQRTILFHFLPAFIFYSLSLLSNETQPKVLHAAFSEGTYHPIALSLIISLFVIGIFYGILILRLVRKNQKKYRNEYAETTIYLTLDWLKYLTIIIVVIASMALFAISFSQYFDQSYIVRFSVEAVFLIIILATSYFAFRQPTLYKESNENSGLIEEEIEKLDEPIKASKPLIDAERIGQISIKLDQYLSEKQPFLNPKIRMPEIADAIEITPNEFSWYLNEHKKTNFFTFINELRINHATQLLKDKAYEHYTLEALSKMSGFRSKTTFNNRFKEIKNVTPSAFRKSIRH